MYTIVFYRDDKKIGSSPWPGDLAGAKSHAISYMGIHDATSVVVVDADKGNVVFMKERTAKS